MFVFVIFNMPKSYNGYSKNQIPVFVLVFVTHKRKYTLLSKTIFKYFWNTKKTNKTDFSC